MISLAEALFALSNGEADWVVVSVEGHAKLSADPPELLVPGSFNPLHHGHTELASIAGRRYRKTVGYEISVFNVDKPPLSLDEVVRRTTQFINLAPVVLTRAPTFVEKAQLFPGRIFAVGADTAARVVDPRYHRNDHVQLFMALEKIRANNCRFLVGGRSMQGGPFTELASLAIPEPHADLFEGISESEFRVDISSTQLRGGKER